MMFEADCTRCGERYIFSSMRIGQTDHRGYNAERRGFCEGLPKRIYEVHTSEHSLMDALLERLLEPSKPRPLIRYRPAPSAPWEEGAEMILLETDEEFESQYPRLAKILLE